MCHSLPLLYFISSLVQTCACEVIKAEHMCVWTVFPHFWIAVLTYIYLAWVVELVLATQEGEELVAVYQTWE